MNFKKNYSTSTALLDLLFNTVLGFVALFFIAFIMMNPKEKENENTESKAEFLVTVSWPNDQEDDVDSYMEDPLGHLVFFRRREDGLMHLDRDDLGGKNDRIQTPLGMVEFKENREILTVRGIIPGEYTVNVHMYRKNGEKPVEVTVQLDKMNPSMTTAALRKIILHTNGDEKTAFRFTIDKEGKITNLNELEKPLASTNLNQNDYYQSPDYGEDEPESVPDYENDYLNPGGTTTR